MIPILFVLALGVCA